MVVRVCSVELYKTMVALANQGAHEISGRKEDRFNASDSSFHLNFAGGVNVLNR